MRAYDLALVVIRIAGALQIVQSVVSLLSWFCRVTVNLTASHQLGEYGRMYVVTELSQITFPLEMVVGGVVILVFSRNIARFCAKAVDLAKGL